MQLSTSFTQGNAELNQIKMQYLMINECITEGLQNT